MKTIARFTIVLVALALCLAGCVSTRLAPPSTQIPPPVPQKADLLGKIEVAKIVNDQDFADLYAEIASRNTSWPQTWDAAIREVKDEDGIDLRDFTEAVVFADASMLAESISSSKGSSLPYCGALVKGNLDEKAFISNLESKIGQKFETSSYHSYKVYACAQSHGQESFSIVFPSEGQMVIGSTDAVMDVVDIMAGLEKPISGAVYDLYSRLGNALIKLASSVPQSLINQIPAEIPIGPAKLDISSFKDINCATLTLSNDKSAINANGSLEFTNEGSAKKSRGLLQTSIKLGKYVVPDPNIRELLGKLHISGSGSSISIKCVLTISEVAQLTSAIFQEVKPEQPMTRPVPGG